MRKIVTKLQSSTQGNKVVLALGEDPQVSVGDIVEAVVIKQSLGNMKVSSIYKIPLMDIKPSDLTGFIYGMPNLFWARFESAMGTGLPGEYPVTFVTLVPVWEELEEILALEEDDEEPVVKTFDDGEKPVSKKKAPKKRHEEKPRDIWSRDLDEED